MTSFEAGFIKYASECGLPETQIRHILKRALAHPEAQQLASRSPEADETSPEDLDTLNEMMLLDDNDKQMDAFRSRLNLQ